MMFKFKNFISVVVCLVLVLNGANAQQHENLLDMITSQSQIMPLLLEQLSQQFDLNFLLGNGNGSSIDYLGLLTKYGDMVNMLTDYLKNNFDLFEFNEQLRNVSTTCRNKTVEFVKALQGGEEWALQTMDSWGKPDSGIISGAISWVGEYRMCLNVTKFASKWPSKYCIVKKPAARTVSPTIASLTYGICVSSECSSEDIAGLLNFGLSFIVPFVSELPPPLDFALIDGEYIECKEPKGYYASTIVVLVLIITLVLIVLVASAYDKIRESRENSAVKDAEKNGNGVEAKQKPTKGTLATLASGLSVINNAKRLFHVSKSADHFDCLNAIRVISITWVIVGHVYMQSMGPANNMVVAFGWFRQFWFLLITNATFSVDTFFLMSGFLLTVIFLRETKRMNSKITLSFMFKYYFHRYWRITPLYMIVVLMAAFLTRNLGEGPFFPNDGFEPDMCRETWWINIFYLQNFIKPEKLCLGLSWYLANDMQFHWIAPIFLIPFALGKRRVGLLLCVMFIVIHILCNSLIIDAKGYHMGLLNTANQASAGLFFRDIYIKPYARIGPFAIGALLGFALTQQNEKENKSTKLDWRINIIGWLISFGACFLMIFGIYPDFSGEGEGLSQTARNMYQTFSRLVWSCGVAYIIYACITSNGGIVNKILSHRLWAPLSRLSFTVYLIHMNVNNFFMLRLEHPIYLQHDTIFYSFISTWTISFGLAFLFNIFFESPFISLEKFMFRRK